MPSSNALRQGFTLIELSIVLVVIGLIVGSVLVGRDLLHTTEIRATIRQIEAFNTAFTAFKLKYNCLPGDCSSASNFGFTGFDGGVANGDGNGQINAYESGVYEESREPLNGFHQLTEAGLVEGGLSGVVDMKLKTTYVVPGYAPAGFWMVALYRHATLIDRSKHYFWSTASYMNDDNGITTVYPIDAFAIDNKMDDGLPTFGRVRASNGDHTIVDDYSAGLSDLAGTTGPAGPASDVCNTNATPSRYNVQNTSHAEGSLCTVIVQADF